jgi:hypothetical protein
VTAGRPEPTLPGSARSADGRDTLEEERRLLAGVSQLIQQGERVAALERLAAHARRFPTGRLSSMRERLRRSALRPVGGSTNVGAP